MRWLGANPLWLVGFVLVVAAIAALWLFVGKFVGMAALNFCFLLATLVAAVKGRSAVGRADKESEVNVAESEAAVVGFAARPLERRLYQVFIVFIALFGIPLFLGILFIDAVPLGMRIVLGATALFGLFFRRNFQLRCDTVVYDNGVIRGETIWGGKREIRIGPGVELCIKDGDYIITGQVKQHRMRFQLDRTSKALVATITSLHPELHEIS